MPIVRYEGDVIRPIRLDVETEKNRNDDVRRPMVVLYGKVTAGSGVKREP